MSGKRKHPRWNPEAHEVDPKPARIPYADRPEAREYCTCSWLHTTNPHDPTGPCRERRIHNPTCELHGDDAKEAPF